MLAHAESNQAVYGSGWHKYTCLKPIKPRGHCMLKVDGIDPHALWEAMITYNNLLMASWPMVPTEIIKPNSRTRAIFSQAFFFPLKKCINLYINLLNYFKIYRIPGIFQTLEELFHIQELSSFQGPVETMNIARWIEHAAIVL